MLPVLHVVPRSQAKHIMHMYMIVRVHVCIYTYIYRNETCMHVSMNIDISLTYYTTNTHTQKKHTRKTRENLDLPGKADRSMQ